MISILVPVYNFLPDKLTLELEKQLLDNHISGEIILVDDASTKPIQKDLLKLQSNVVQVEILTENKGRSRIRNYIAAKAKYPYLLFLDGDSKIIKPDFIQTYLSHATPQTVIYGGRVYPSSGTKNQSKIHYFYGVFRESRPIAERKHQPYLSFQSNNFLIEKKLFCKIKMQEQLTQYGYEDILFALELKKRNIPVIHIENPVEHIDIEDNQTFIRKQKQAAENLAWLYAHQMVSKDIRLIDFYERHHFLATLFSKVPETYIEKKLWQTPNNLKWLDLLKLKIFYEKLQSIQ